MPHLKRLACDTCRNTDDGAQSDPSPPLDIDRAAWFLSRRFGDDCALVAYHRALACARTGDKKSEAEWRHVVRRLIETHFARPTRWRH